MNYKKELHNLCTQMIQTPSVTGSEMNVVQFIRTKMIKLGYDEVIVDKVGNVIGKINSNVENGKTVLFDGHLDTVAIPNRAAWKKEPFGAEFIDGKIYGRGSSDMKGALAAMIIAAIKVKDSNVPHGDIYVSGTIFEEIAEGFSLRTVINIVNPDYVVIGESTSLKLNIGQRGRAEIKVVTKGVPSHSANPERGVNAVSKMVELLNEIRKIESPTHPQLGKGELVLTDIISNPFPGASVVPSSCSITFDRRLLVGETPEVVLLPIKDVIERLSKADPKFEAKAEIASMTIQTYTGFSANHQRFAPGWLMDKNSEIVVKAKQALKKATDNDPIINCYSFCTNGSSSAGELNIPTIGFGPSEEYLAHIDDEYIEVESLDKALDGYEQLAISLSL
jgi:putative selenium metabolism hydrolase